MPNTDYRVRWSRHRIIPMLAAVALALVACQVPAGTPGASGSNTQDRLTVVTTFTVLADIAENVAGDRLEVVSITKPGAEIHDYEPTPSDIRRAQDADLIVDNGLALERWFEQFVADLDVPHVVASEGIDPIAIDGGEDAGMANPHAWMSPMNVQTYVDNLVAAFTALDPDGAEEFAANGQEYNDQLQEVHDELLATLEAIPRAQRALVTCEGAFSYLGRDAGLEEQYLWAVNEEEGATAQQLAGTIEFVQDRQVPAVFCESTVSDKSMQRVIDATGVEFGGMLYVDSLSLEDGPVPTYLDLITYDAELIAEGLTQS